MIGTITAVLFDEARRIFCYRWLALAVGLGLFVATAAYVLHMPDVYDAWGQIFVSKQTPLTTAAEGVSLVGDSYGSTYVVQKTMLNDDNLEAVVKSRDPNVAGLSKTQLASAVGQLRGHIHVSPDSGDGFVEVHYGDTNPVRARQTAQLLMDQFIAKNVDRSRTDLDRAEKFLDQQLAAYGEMLSGSQANIADFRRAHPEVTFIPQPGMATPFDIQQTVSNADEPQPAAQVAQAPPPKPVRPSQAAERVAGLQAKLTGLRTTYTEQYPDVVSTRRQLADAMVDEQREEAVAAAAATAEASAEPAPTATASTPRVQRRYAGPRLPPNVAPDIAAHWVDLQRKDEVLRLGYQQLIGKREAARMSQVIYGANDSGKYQVTRAPTTPTAPYGPKRGLLLAVGALLSIAAGIGAAYLRAGMKGILVAPRELESAFQLPVVGTVSLERAWQTPRHLQAPRKRLFLPSPTA